MTHCSVTLTNVSLAYELHFDRTISLKEYLINKAIRRKYVDEAKNELLALNDVTLTLKEGDRVGVIGLNGAGKSTLLKVVTGIFRPTLGSVSVEGTIQPLIEVGAGFNPEFSGRENIYFNGYMLGFTKTQIKAREAEVVEFAELGKFIDVPIKYYSTGMVVRLAFAMATSINPEILVFDEMLSAGDAAFIDKARKRLDGLLEQAKILLVVSHDLGLVQSLTKHVLVLDHGKIVFQGKPAEAVKYYLEMIEAKRAAGTLRE